jgi:Raf kinase inhibitor-like YbhB/YbcL family protein
VKKILALFLMMSSLIYAAPFALHSKTFKASQYIPHHCACSGANESPQLSWSGLPSNTKTLVIICEDPDAGPEPFVHWIAFNIPAHIKSLALNIPKTPLVTIGNATFAQGLNDLNKVGYTGPCPPVGTTHRYLFRIYALDATLPLQAGATKELLLRTMNKHVVDSAELMGLFKRAENDVCNNGCWDLQ